MNLYLLRHSKAEPRGAAWRSDSKRPLSPEGEKIIQIAARGMLELDVTLDLIVTSPFARASKTAAITAEVFKTDKIWTSQNLVPDGEPSKLITELNDNYASLSNLMIVGHEPYMSELLSVLLTGETGMRVNFKKAALCKLTVDSLRLGRCATLEWFLTAKQLQKFGKH
jgi:phosphohistidine phosphatase